MSPKLSVIVPVYNVENYLEDCIKSILTQSFQDFELILVNDGSTDNSLRICNQYKESDSRIKVIDKVNEGVSTARNFGIYQAIGEWMCFVDSDDVVDTHYFTNLIENTLNSDFILGGITIIECETESKKILAPKKVVNVELTNFDLLNNLSSLLLASPISKLFKRKIVIDNKLKFDERIHIGEDYLFVSSYLLYTKKLSLIQNSDYFYYRRKGSLSTSYNNTVSELLAEQELYNSTIKLYEKLQYNFDLVQSLYLREFKKHAYRILFSLYCNKHVTYTKKNRIDIVKDINKDQRTRILRMLKSNGTNGYIISFLFNNICIFDSVLNKLINVKLK